ncbi:hypothetical protein [Phyllobacterium sophorae]|uniref:Uncharacterized protein n=1 Tax=Phyllobacterium sophorae TaxID=1520277 RepID=A0A2P7BFJ6_9HYPH|nr:hypothetical protein [Phyllobacterium sophorae]PSH65247.1 hypothetical protein CU103_09540 [Phyllobacterium sophorae]
MENLITIGIATRDLVLALASLLKQPWAPGLFSLALVVVLLVVLVVFLITVRSRIGVLKRATKLIRRYHGNEGLQHNLEEISAELSSWKGADAAHLAETWSEFRETTIEPRAGQHGIRNAIRPSVFFNLEEMGFGVSGWRSAPGLFVSVGLAATFLGLIAALQQTGESLQVGSDDAAVTGALTQLLSVASAKFIMSLTGLMCSIVFTVVLRRAGNHLEAAMRRLTHDLEKRLNFVSLEDIAERQLNAIVEQRDHMQKLNHELIAAISEPLHAAVTSGANQVGDMVQSLAGSLSNGLVAAMTATSDRLDSASGKLAGLATEISSAAEQFSVAAERTAVGLDGAARRLEVVSDNLARAGNGLADAAGPVVKAAEKTATATEQIAKSSVEMVETARKTMASERDLVVAAASSIMEQIKSFEARAAAYDGQLERAFKTFTEEIGRSISEVENHSDNVHRQYADALGTLQSVIENAKAFQPESERPVA